MTPSLPEGPLPPRRLPGDGGEHRPPGGGRGGRVGGERHRGRGHPRGRIPPRRAHQERQLHLAQRPPPARRPGEAPGPPRAPGQRRQLLHPLRGGGRRRRHRGHRLRGDPGDRRGRRPGGGRPDPHRGQRHRRRPPCYCGRRGCIETWLSGPGLAADHQRHTGETLTARQIAQRAENGDPAARATLERHSERLARALATVVNVFDPHVIVLGGGLSQMAHLYRQVPRLWGRWVFSDRVDTRLAPPRHGDASGVRGAAWLWGGPPPRKHDR